LWPLTGEYPVSSTLEANLIITVIMSPIPENIEEIIKIEKKISPILHQIDKERYFRL
jgi:hypothetical protein